MAIIEIAINVTAENSLYEDASVKLPCANDIHPLVRPHVAH